MKLITYSDIFKMNPCYAPNKYIPKTWTGTVLDILNLEQVPTQDRLWAVLRPGYLSDKTMRLFAVACAKRISHLCQDDRSLKAIEIAERFANGEAAVAELDAARDAVQLPVARTVTWYAAWNAAWDTSRAAARDAAWNAAWDAAGAATWGVAWGATWDAARDAAQGAEEIEQIKILRNLIIIAGTENMK